MYLKVEVKVKVKVKVDHNDHWSIRIKLNEKTSYSSGEMKRNAMQMSCKSLINTIIKFNNDFSSLTSLTNINKVKGAFEMKIKWKLNDRILI